MVLMIVVISSLKNFSFQNSKKEMNFSHIFFSLHFSSACDKISDILKISHDAADDEIQSSPNM